MLPSGLGSRRIPIDSSRGRVQRQWLHATQTDRAADTIAAAAPHNQFDEHYNIIIIIIMEPYTLL